MRLLLVMTAAVLCGWAGLSLPAETTVVNGVVYECTDGMCRPVNAGGSVPRPSEGSAPGNLETPELLQGYASAEQLLEFFRGETAADADGGERHAAWWWALVALIGGLALNLTPCVLPMIPINLLIIGKSWRRGTLFGLGMVFGYGALTLAAALLGTAFGALQSSGWFDLAVGLVLLAMSVALLGGFTVDFSRRRLRVPKAVGAVSAVGLGAMSALMAGACVAPVVVSVVTVVAGAVAAREYWAVVLPLLLGLGMALPWPLLGAGLQVLPKPGKWMRWVNRILALGVLAMSVWHLRASWRAFDRDVSAGGAVLTPAELPRALATARRPTLVRVGASWCRSCAAMAAGPLRDPRVRAAMAEFAVLEVDAEDIAELTRLPQFAAVRGLPALAIFR